MQRQLKCILLGCAEIAGCLGLVVGARVEARAGETGHIVLHATRESATDLELTGMVRGIGAAGNAYVEYAELMRMPQVSAVVDDDADYPGVTMHAKGVPLGALQSALGGQGSDLISALCTDGYLSQYPAEAISAHKPLLVLTIDGMAVSVWAAKMHQDDPGPYLVLYSHFVPAFHVLAHVDRPQLPTNVMRLEFGTQAATFGAIAPGGRFADRSPEQQGYAIAKQNCLRCHAMGQYGGTKAGTDWKKLGAMAMTRSDYFASYIRDPKAINPKTQMPANLEYDAATLAALTAYFLTFGDEAAR